MIPTPGPCPFCGSNNAELEWTTAAYGMRHYVVCPDCEATGSEMRTYKEAVDVWDQVTRQGAAVRAQRDALADALRKIDRDALAADEGGE